MPRDHFDISDKSHDYNYSSRTGFPNDGRPIPQRDRSAHSQHVAQMFLAAKQENRQYRETARLSSAPEGYYLKIQNQQGKDLALKNLDSRQIGHLINIREQGAGAEKMIEVTLFLKEQKNEWLNRKIDEYQHQNTSKNKPRNQELIDTIEQITGAQLEDLWIGSESEPMPQDAKQWIEVWFFCEDQLYGDQEFIVRQKTLLHDLDVEFKENTLTFPERIVLTIHANRSDMLRIMAASGDIVAFAPCPIVAGFIVDEDPRQQQEWVEMIDNDFNAPADADVFLCILDSGVNHQHPLLQRIIQPEDCLAAVDDWGIDDNKNHGTLMAGNVIYGDLSDYIAGRNNRGCKYRLCSVKLLSPSLDGNDILWGERHRGTDPMCH